MRAKEQRDAGKDERDVRFFQLRQQAVQIDIAKSKIQRPGADNCRYGKPNRRVLHDLIHSANGVPKIPLREASGSSSVFL